VRGLVAAVARIDLALYRLCQALGVAALVAVVGVALSQVLWRYALRQPLIWTEELATYLFIWLSMLGAATATYERGHYGFDLLLRRLDSHLRRWAEGAVLAGCVAMSVVLGLLCTQMALEARDTSASLQVGMVWFYAALPVGAWAMAWHHLARLVAIWSPAP
jgi:TRAP-type C4-dicarboxylate transport system permease small subunit